MSSCFSIRADSSLKSPEYWIDFEIENRSIQLLLGGEVAEDDGFVDARGGGNFLGRSSAEPFPGEQVDRNFYELPLPFFAAETFVFCK